MVYFTTYWAKVRKIGGLCYFSGPATPPPPVRPSPGLPRAAGPVLQPHAPSPAGPPQLPSGPPRAAGTGSPASLPASCQVRLNRRRTCPAAASPVLQPHSPPPARSASTAAGPTLRCEPGSPASLFTSRQVRLNRRRAAGRVCNTRIL